MVFTKKTLKTLKTLKNLDNLEKRLIFIKTEEKTNENFNRNNILHIDTFRITTD